MGLQGIHKLVRTHSLRLWSEFLYLSLVPCTVMFAVPVTPLLPPCVHACVKYTLRYLVYLCVFVPCILRTYQAKELALKEGLLKDPQELKKKWKMSKVSHPCSPTCVGSKPLRYTRFASVHTYVRTYVRMCFDCLTYVYTCTLYVEACGQA